MLDYKLKPYTKYNNKANHIHRVYFDIYPTGK